MAKSLILQNWSPAQESKKQCIDTNPKTPSKPKTRPYDYSP